MSIRRAASCGQPLHDSDVPRGARISILRPTPSIYCAFMAAEDQLSDHLASPDIRPGDKPGELLVFDHGFVRLDAAMADDLSVVNSARVSFAVRREEMEERDKGLIRFLMRERHGTPTEHNAFRFHVRCPIFVAREWFRHRVGCLTGDTIVSFDDWG